MLGPLPDFSIVEHIINLGRPISLQEVENLSVDVDESLVASLKSSVGDFEDADDTSEDGSGGEEEGMEKQSPSVTEHLGGAENTPLDESTVPGG